MATTTTAAAIRAQLTTVIEGLTPGTDARVPYRRRLESRQPLAQRGTNSATFYRNFQIIADGTPAEADLQAPSEKRRREEWTLAITYPVLQGLGGDLGIEGLEDLIRADQEQLWDAIHDADNWLAGVRDMYPQATTIERGESVLISTIIFQVEYLVARSA